MGKEATRKKVRELKTEFSNLRELTPVQRETVARILYLLDSILSDDADSTDTKTTGTNVAPLEVAHEQKMFSEFDKELGSHEAGVVIIFILLFALEKLKRARTRGTLRSILHAAGVPGTGNNEYNPILTARLHRMERESLITKTGKGREITFALAPAGKDKLRDINEKTSTPIIDEYLKMMLPDVRKAIAKINERGLDLD